MPPRPLVITNIKYKSIKRRGRGSGARGLDATLKYLEFREDRDTRVTRGGAARWVDRGLGPHYRAIFQECSALKSQHVLAWTWVISPEPDLLARLPVPLRRPFIRELTEAVVEHYYAVRGGYTVPYSYVVHDARTRDGRPHTHTHVVLPGLADHPLDGLVPFTNYRDRGHLALLDAIATDEISLALDRTLGRDWRRDFGHADPHPAPVPADSDDLDRWFPR